MTLREQFEQEYNGWKAVANKSVITNYTNEYVHWLESKLKQLQNTSSNSEYAKCIRCNDSNRSRLCEKCIDEIRPFV